MYRIFVYGTLKRGYRNNQLLSGQRFICEAKTEAAYKLYHNGSYPCLVHGESEIDGEIWEVDDEKCMARLDRLEGVPFLYQREELRIHGHTGIIGYIYQQPVIHLQDSGNCWPPK